MFLGTPRFAVPSLRALAAEPEIDVPLVVTQPDRPAGRGRQLTPPAVKLAAADLSIPVTQPESLRDDDVVAQIAATDPDLLVVVAYGELLRRNVLSLTPLGCLNVHPSLLPTYRGAAPIPAAILNGDQQTGVTIMKLVRKLDAGPILVQSVVDVKQDDTAGSLSERLSRVAAALLPGVVIGYAAGEIEPRPQDDEEATHTREWTTADARIDWSLPAAQIARLVRAANPWPVAWTTISGDRFRILLARAAEPPDNTFEPGEVSTIEREVVVGTGGGTLTLETVQPSGKRAMPALDWWRGLRKDRLRFDGGLGN